MDAATVRLTDLHDRWISTINHAVGRGLPAAALDELADEYADAALALLSDALGAGHAGPGRAAA